MDCRASRHGRYGLAAKGIFAMTEVGVVIEEQVVIAKLIQKFDFDARCLVHPLAPQSSLRNRQAHPIFGDVCKEQRV